MKHLSPTQAITSSFYNDHHLKSFHKPGLLSLVCTSWLCNAICISENANWMLYKKLPTPLSRNTAHEISRLKSPKQGPCAITCLLLLYFWAILKYCFSTSGAQPVGVTSSFTQKFRAYVLSSHICTNLYKDTAWFHSASCVESKLHLSTNSHSSYFLVTSYSQPSHGLV